MSVTFKADHLKKYKDLALLFMKYGRSNLVEQAGLQEVLENEISDTKTLPPPEELVHDLEKLGPTYIKLGQLLSTRADFLPPEYLEALSRLQDKVAPFSYAEVEEITKQELGLRISKAFAELESEPVAAASLGQVHRGIMREYDTEFAKRQMEIFQEDLTNSRKITRQEWKNRPLMEKLSEWSAGLLRNQL